MVNLLAREAWDDTVNEGGTDIAVFVEPSLEACVVLAEVIFPQFDILADTFLKVMSVEEYEFARHDDEAFLWVSVECLETTEEKLGELARIGRCRSVGKLA